MFFHLQRRGKQRGRVDVSVSMNLPEARKSRILESGNQSHHLGLLAEFQVVLKSNQVVRVCTQVLLSQLHDCIRRLASSRISQTDGLHWPEAQGISAAARNFLDGKAAL